MADLVRRRDCGLSHTLNIYDKQLGSNVNPLEVLPEIGPTRLSPLPNHTRTPPFTVSNDLSSLKPVCASSLTSLHRMPHPSRDSSSRSTFPIWAYRLRRSLPSLTPQPVTAGCHHQPGPAGGSIAETPGR